MCSAYALFGRAFVPEITESTDRQTGGRITRQTDEKEKLPMKKFAFLLVAALLLAGCGAPEKKPIQSSNPSAQGSDPAGIASSSSGAAGTSQTAGSKSNSARSSSAGTSPQAVNAEQVLAGSETVMVNGRPTLKNPDSTMVLVNKTHNLPSDWEPDDLVIPDIAFPEGKAKDVKYLRKAAASAIKELFDGALSDGIELYGVSGYRSYARQKSIYNTEVNSVGVDAANKAVAYPGQSEHETGLSMDVSCKSMGYMLDESFEDTKEGKWLKQHCGEYGFIIRYPKDKVDITKYMYEPWHIRYVGKQAAKYITDNKISFEEYHNMMSPK